MSCIYKGQVIDTDLSRNAKGGTEMMRDRLLRNVDTKLLEQVAIHFSRPRQLYDDVPNILYCHDLAGDHENKILANDGWRRFDKFVFVSFWQRDSYINEFGVPYSKCQVIPNAIELEHVKRNKRTDEIRFIYHTTPHRGLELLVPIFDALVQKGYDNIHLDVYSSFKIYGWEKRDAPYKPLFDRIEAHPNMTYHGSVPNEQVLEALQRSHVFLYPCIWQETSCIAMIEAIKAGCVVIHPHYGALTETGTEGACMPYNFHEDPNEHLRKAFEATWHFLDLVKKYPNLINELTNNNPQTKRHTIEAFKVRWEATLKGILQNV